MLKSVKIKNKLLEVPIIQGGMGIGVSLSSLAGNVMKEGAMGVISAAHPGYRKEDFLKDSVKANSEAIFEEVEKARKISGGRGLLGVNIMVAMKDFDTYVKVASEANVDAIICGAGLPIHLPKLVDNENILLAPIVSSARAMKLIANAWDRHYQKVPDFVVIESSEAGGHLGFKKEELLSNSSESLEEILLEVQTELKPYCDKYNKSIPIFVAGGIFDGNDIAHFIKLGAKGVQIGTRFAITVESDADVKFKEAIISAKKEDIVIVESPAGFPARALKNTFLESVSNRGNVCISKCLTCLKTCNPKSTPYCITQALIQAVKGNIEKGLIFVGANAHRCKKIISVEALIKELVTKANIALGTVGAK